MSQSCLDYCLIDRFVFHVFRVCNVSFSILGFYGRPWTCEQRKELFVRYGDSYFTSQNRIDVFEYKV